MFSRVLLNLTITIIGIGFGLLGLLGRRGRATHTFGVGATGLLEILAKPLLPENSFFQAGMKHQIQVRHGNVTFEDDASKDVRSASLKLSLEEYESPLDLLMNTGPESVFWNLTTFIQFGWATALGESGLKRYVKKDDDRFRAACGALRRAPSSYAELIYYTQVPLHFDTTDGTGYLAKFRLLPSSGDLESGIPTGKDALKPWDQARRAGDVRTRHYLRDEFRNRLADGPVVYRLQIQLHPRSEDDDSSIYHSGKAWDEAIHPWQDLGTVTLNSELPYETVERLRFWIGNLPTCLSVPKARSITDYNSIAFTRLRVYPLAQRLRKIGYCMRGVPETRIITGQLVHRDVGRLSLYNKEVELWDKKIWPGTKLTQTWSDQEGRFSMEYRACDTGWLRKARPDLLIKVFDHPWIGTTVIRQNRRCIGSARGPRNFSGAIMNFGKLHVNHWEYNLGFPFPSVLRLCPKIWRPQMFSLKYIWYLIRTNWRTVASTVWLLLVDRVSRSGPSLDRIQRGFSTNLTVMLGPTSREDEFFVYRILNGFNPAMLRKVEGRYDEFYAEVDWFGYEGDLVHDVTNAKAFFKKVDGKLEATQIQLYFRSGRTALEAPYTGPIYVAQPNCQGNDEVLWQQAKRVFRCAWLGAGEMDTHLCMAHLNVEQYAIAAFRNLERSPVTCLLFPHLKDVVTINFLGASLIFGTKGVLSTNSPLTTDASWNRLEKQLGRLDWSNWTPRSPLYDGHTYAKAANLFWTALNHYIEAFFQRHKNTVIEHWHEVHRFSNDLVNHSVEYTKPSKQEGQLYCTNEGNRSDSQREHTAGLVRAVRSITSTAVNPGDSDLENLKQVCRYIIFHATLFHTWTNDLQITDGGEIRYATLGLRGGSMGEEGDPKILPRKVECIKQTAMARLLAINKRGTIMRDEDKDIPSEFRKQLELIRDDYRGLANEFEDPKTFNIGYIRSRINI